MVSPNRYTDLDPNKSNFAGSRVLLLGRDIRDTLVSAFFQASRRVGVFEGTMSEFIRSERFGVMNLDVKEPAEGAEGEEQAAEPPAGSIDEEKLTEEIHARFSKIGDDERMGLIRDAVTRQLVRSGVSKPI